MSECDCFSMGVHNCPMHGPEWARRRADRAIADIMRCEVPPAGWSCTRSKGHSGPCAARECECGWPEGHQTAVCPVIVKRTQPRWGFLFRWRSAWVGLHYSVACKRFCLNLLPCCTFWWTRPGGDPPDARKL